MTKKILANNITGLIFLLFHTLTFLLFTKFLMTITSKSLKAVLPKDVYVPAIAVSLSTVVAVVLYIFVYNKITKKDNDIDFWPKLNIDIKWLILAGFLAIAMILIASGIQALIPDQVGTNFTNNGNKPETSLGAGGPIQLGLSAVIIAPFVEELFFRGVLRDVMKKCYPALYVIASGLIFGIIHTQITSINWVSFLTTGIFGLILGALAWKTNNTFYTMLTHFLYNGIIVMGILLNL